jgi:GDPmannose 4,6-dehydratase
LLSQQENIFQFVNLLIGLQQNWASNSKLKFVGSGVDEVAIVESVICDDAPAVKVGDIIMKIDPRYFRPTDVETVLGDPFKAKQKLGWKPSITARDMCAEMIAEDLDAAKRNVLLKAHGYEVSLSAKNHL